MAVKIRLQRQGRKKRPYYHIVIADSRSPRDGRFIEKIGSYNPMSKPATIDLDREKAFDWMMKGAVPSDTVRAILKLKGLLYRKHLARGVKKGALTQEQADQMYNAFVQEKEAKLTARFEETQREKAAFLEAVSGTAAPIKEAPVEEAVEEAPAVEEGTEESAVSEAPAEETTEEAPATEEEATVEAPAEAEEAKAPAVEEAAEEAPVEEEATEEDASKEE